MSRYTGPKARINRRLGKMIYEDAGSIKAMERRETPPGMHPQGRRPSNYGLALMEKQKIKHYYGLGERQLLRLFTKAKHMKGNTGEQLLLLCERRLDNVIRRVGFTKTRPQARQGVSHGHFLVNDVKVTSPSFLVRPGDMIALKTKDKLKTLYLSILSEGSPEALDWVSFDAEGLTANVLGLPGPSDVSLPIEDLSDANIVVEFLSR